jgi:hypothetical protein
MDAIFIFISNRYKNMKKEKLNSYKIMFKKITFLLITSLFFLSTAQAKVHLIGGETSFSNKISAHFNKKMSSYNEEIDSKSLLYVNIGLMTDDEINIVREYILDKKLTILDFTNMPDIDNRTIYSKELIGLSITSEYLVVGTLNGDFIVNAILTQVEDNNMTDKQINDGTLSSFIHVLERFGFGDKS